MESTVLTAEGTSSFDGKKKRKERWKHPWKEKEEREMEAFIIIR